MAPVSLAHLAIKSLSIGFIENISTTLQEMPFLFSSFAASSALLTIRPHPIIVASEPSSRMLPLPISNALDWSA
jgi:hypothetical protein